MNHPRKPRTKPPRHSSLEGELARQGRKPAGAPVGGSAGTAPVRERGFTLLEVIVAMTITGFVLGGLFTLLGSSKQLSLRANDSLHEAAQLRATVNFALLENDYNEVAPVLQGERFEIRAGELLEAPPRKTAGSTQALESFEIHDPERGQSVHGTRWVRLSLPR